MEQRTILLRDEDYPSTLKRTEIENPILVVCDFFKKYPLQQAQTLLWQWLPHRLTDEVKLCPELRLKLYRFCRELERLTDAAWVLTVKKGPSAPLPDRRALKEWITGGHISFLSHHEAQNPIRTLTGLFRSETLKDFKMNILGDWKRCLLDSLFWINPSLSISEFVQYLELNKLMECCWLYHQYTTDSQNTVILKEKHWSIQFAEATDPDWAINYYRNGGYRDSLQCLALLYHYKRWCIEWHPAAVFRVSRCYGTLYRLLQLAINFSQRDSPDIPELNKIHQSIRMLLKNCPSNNLFTFLNSCITDSWEFRPAISKLKPDQKELGVAEQLLLLTATYFTLLTKTENYKGNVRI